MPDVSVDFSECGLCVDGLLRSPGTGLEDRARRTKQARRGWYQAGTRHEPKGQAKPKAMAGACQEMKGEAMRKERWIREGSETGRDPGSGARAPALLWAGPAPSWVLEGLLGVGRTQTPARVSSSHWVCPVGHLASSR